MGVIHLLCIVSPIRIRFLYMAHIKNQSAETVLSFYQRIHK